MKYMIKSLSDKITAIFIFLLLAELAVAMFLAIDCLADYRFYSDGGEAYAVEETLRVKTNPEFENIEYYTTLKLEGRDYSDVYTLYNRERSNIVFAVRSEEGGLILSNLLDNDNFNPDTDAEYKSVKPLNICTESGENAQGTITLYLRKGLPANDSFRLAMTLIKTANIVKYPLLVMLVIFLLAAIIDLGMIMSSIGRRSGDSTDDTPTRFIDRIPFDLMVIIMSAIVAFIVMLMVLTSVADIKKTNLVLWNAVILILSLVFSSVLLLFSITLATRIKYGHVYRNTLVFRIISGIRKKAGKKNDGYFKVPFIGKVIITISIMALLELMVTLFFMFNYRTHENELLSEFKFLYYAIFQVFVTVVLASLFFMMALNLYHLRVSSKKLAHRNFDYTDDTTILFGDFREISNDFEFIRDDMIKAMEEKNKSVQLRNELIANISHDIKTPLTSIINYADIVSSGGCDEEELKNYLGVISHQSEKLNDLLQSLIEVSKISTGQIEANFESLDIGLYLSQVIEEFAPAFDKKGLTADISTPDESVIISCDSSMLWRVFENLLNNIVKYAMPDTRVYFEIGKADGRAVISIKNMSAQKITLSAEELLQRFKRNDKSRSTGGNGLGLSIAKSFTEFQNGTFGIEIDGDLFKSILTFELSE
ncbi:MAG: HAMP domain-containing histidine kinase [Clostridia bacterium]|nr:HAMP domain-containing histidine kinase [Clostridia bacterium]